MMKKEDRREKYDDKMKRLGFKKIQPWVHHDDKKEVLDLCEELREKRLNSSCIKSDSDI